MLVRSIKENVYSVGALDWDRQYFDELIPLPDGTTYNSYIIKGKDKTALIDTVDPSKESVLLGNLDELGIKKIDYLISLHGEQDHSGSIPKIISLFPDAKIVANQKCKEELKELLLLPEDKFIVITDRGTLSLGDKTLEFIFTPWVHWPETMSVFLQEDKILFSCDFFGSHVAESELFAGEDNKVVLAAKRYYAEIMMPFRTTIKNNIEKIKDLEIKFIAPSHGPVYDKPEFIINAYKDWVSDNVKNEVLVPYVSMHGSTKIIVDYFVGKLAEKGIIVKPFNLINADVGEIAISLVDAATIVIGSPTVVAGPHPLAANIAFIANMLRPKAKFASVIGSFLWGGRMVENLVSMMPNLKVELLPPVVAKGYPKESDFKELDRLAEDIISRHKSLGLL